MPLTVFWYNTVKSHKNIMAVSEKHKIITKTAEAPAEALGQAVLMTQVIHDATAKNKILKKTKNYWHMLGPGLTTGASDDDPSGIATYSQVGAQFGYGLLWMAPGYSRV